VVERSGAFLQAAGGAGFELRAELAPWPAPGTAGAAAPGGPDAAPSLYLPFVRREVEVFLDGRKLEDPGDPAPPGSGRRYRPLLIGLPVTDGAPHLLSLRVKAEPDEGALVPGVYVGPRAALAGPYRSQRFLRATLAEAIVVALLVVAVFLGALWLKRPGDTVYGWFAAALVLWAVFNYGYQRSDFPVPRSAVLPLLDAALGWSLFCQMLFVHRFAGPPPVRVERRFAWALAACTAAGVAAALTGPQPAARAALRLLDQLVWLALGVQMTRHLLAAWRREARRTLVWLASGTVLCIGLAVFDVARSFGLLSPSALSLFPYGALVAVTLFGSILVGRFADALGESERTNLRLDEMVQAKTRELAAEHERSRALEREMTRAEERQRLVRDMHDGMGGQLVVLLSLVRSGEGDPEVLERALAECLDDLRLMIDSMDTASEDLAVGLGMLRARLEPRLRATGLDVRWDTASLPEGLALGSEAVLQVFRIVQECVQNALKHAGARTLWIEARLEGDPAGIRVSVRDDGVGPAGGAARAGRGMGTMRFRAERISGRLSVEAAEPGTRVSLRLPDPR
jgi:signal transduction histidine kinase